MSPDQIAALRTFLAASLAAPPRYGADPVTFPASSVVQSYGDFPRTAGPWCTFRLMTENGLAAEGDQWRESVRQVYRIAFSAGAGVNSVSLAPTNSDFAPSGVTPPTLRGFTPHPMWREMAGQSGTFSDDNAS